MSKESIIVGIFGLSLGLLVAWAIWNFKSPSPQPQEVAVSPTPFAAATPTPAPQVSLTLESPVNDYLATESSILVKGIAKPGDTVVISTNLEDQVLTAGSNGSFSQTISLEEGENTLTVTSYGPGRKEESLQKTVIYTKESL